MGKGGKSDGVDEVKGNLPEQCWKYRQRDWSFCASYRLAILCDVLVANDYCIDEAWYMYKRWTLSRLPSSSHSAAAADMTSCPRIRANNVMSTKRTDSYQSATWRVVNLI